MSAVPSGVEAMGFKEKPMQKRIILSRGKTVQMCKKIILKDMHHMGKNIKSRRAFDYGSSVQSLHREPYGKRNECVFAFLLETGCVQNSSFNPGTAKVLNA